MSSCKLFPSSNSAATHGSGTGLLCPTQIRGTDASGEHLSVPARARTACSAPDRGAGGRQDTGIGGRTPRHTRGAQAPEGIIGWFKCPVH